MGKLRWNYDQEAFGIYRTSDEAVDEYLSISDPLTWPKVLDVYGFEKKSGQERIVKTLGVDLPDWIILHRRHWLREDQQVMEWYKDTVPPEDRLI